MLTAQRSNVAVYTVDPCGLEVDAGCTRASRQNLRTIAEVTGGFAVINTNAPRSRPSIGCLPRTVPTTWLAITRRLRRTTASIIESQVRTRVADVEIRAREGYDSPGKAAKALAATPLEVLTRSAIQTRGLTMRVVAIPAPLSTAPSAAVIVGIELPTAVATRAGRDRVRGRRDRSGRKDALSRAIHDEFRRLGTRRRRRGPAPAHGLTCRQGSTRFASPPPAATNRKAACSWTCPCRSSMRSSVWEGCRLALPAQSPSQRLTGFEVCCR